MKVDERRFKNQHWSPTVKTSLIESASLFMAGRCWGSPDALDLAFDTIGQFMQSIRKDDEATRPFRFLSSLAPGANHLRQALMLANDRIFEQFNQDRYKALVELSAVQLQHPIANVATVGQPCIYHRSHSGLRPINEDFNMMVGPDAESSPIPGNFLGAYETSHFRCCSQRYNQGDQFILSTFTEYSAEALRQLTEASSVQQLESTAGTNSRKWFSWAGYLAT